MRTVALKKFPLVLLFLVVIALPRFINLSADPVPISVLHNQDEGNYSYNTRNLVLEEKLITDLTNFFFVSPVWTFYQYPFVRLFGIKYEAFRFPSAFSSLLLVLAVAIFIKKVSQSNLLSFLAGLLTSLNFLILVHSRMAIPEITTVLFSFLGFASWYFTLRKYPQINLKASLAAALFLVLAFFTKSNGIFMIGTYLISLSFTVLKYRKIPMLKHILIIFVPFVVFLVLYKLSRYYFLTLYPKEFLLAYAELIGKWSTLPEMNWSNMDYWHSQLILTVQGGEAGIWKFIPDLAICGGLSVFILVKKILFRKQISLLELHTLAFVIASLAWFTFIPYKPARFFVIALVPLILLQVTVTKNYPQLGFFLAIVSVVLNGVLGFKFIYTHQTFEDVAVSNYLSENVGSGVVGGGGLDTFGLNSSYKFINTYFVSWGDADLVNYFNSYRWPDYFIVIKDFYAATFLLRPDSYLGAKFKVFRQLPVTNSFTSSKDSTTYLYKVTL